VLAELAAYPFAERGRFGRMAATGRLNFLVERLVEVLSTLTGVRAVRTFLTNWDFFFQSRFYVASGGVPLQKKEC
jgi:hypothetical protein